MNTREAGDGIGQYFEAATEQLQRVLAAQRTNLNEMARLWTEAIKQDKLLYTFGSGHSRFIAGELYWRAGGLAPVMMIEEGTNGLAERVEGYAVTFMSRHDVKPGDLLVVISNSGINPVPIEVALYGKEAGMTVIAVTALDYSRGAKSRHSSGKKLYEIADVTLDTMGVYGDAVVELPGVAWRVAPTSTLISVAMLNAVVAQTTHNLLSEGVTPPVLISANVPEGDAHNQGLSDRYWQRLTKFPLRKP
jgi:uncharacterized phosphosugar-binding protein